MNAANNSSSPLERVFPVLFVFIGLVALYYLYQYLFGPKGQNAYTIVSKTQSATIDPGSPIIVTSDKLPAIYEGGEFTISTWIYISNWSYRARLKKSILSIGGPNFDTIRIYLGGSKPKLHVRLHTKNTSGATNAVPTGVNPSGSSSSTPANSANQVPEESLAKSTQNATFNMLDTGSDLLDSTSMCDLPEIDLQRWVNITVAVNGRTVDVYMDGKLARSCVLPSFYKVDAGGYSAYLLAYGGFGGQMSTTTMYDAALNPEQVYQNYMAGPEPVTNLGSWFSSFFSPGIDISVTTTNK
jgi:hypothetical protein